MIKKYKLCERSLNAYLLSGLYRFAPHPTKTLIIKQ